MLRMIIDQIEAHPEDGSVTVRFRKQFVDPSGAIIDLGYHRSGVMEPGDDVEAHLVLLNAHFAQGIEERDGRTLKFPAVDGAEIKAVAAMMHTPERIAARNARKAKQPGLSTL